MLPSVVAQSFPFVVMVEEVFPPLVCPGRGEYSLLWHAPPTQLESVEQLPLGQEEPEPKATLYPGG